MNANLATKLSLAAATACFLGAFAAAAFAGPSTQWAIRPPAPAKADSSTTLACPACKTTDIRIAQQHGPAGKGTTEWGTVGSKHACALCQGAITSTNTGTTDAMVRNALQCGTKLCCVSTTK